MPQGEASNKAYIGDGVYVAFDGYSLILTAEDGVRATNTIYLEPVVMDSLIEYYMKRTGG